MVQDILMVCQVRKVTTTYLKSGQCKLGFHMEEFNNLYKFNPVNHPVIVSFIMPGNVLHSL